MTAVSEIGQNIDTHDFELGVAGFHYSDLFDAVKLAELAAVFYKEVEERDPIIHSALTKYIAAHGRGYEKRVESKILTDAAPHLSHFIAKMFRGVRERDELQREILDQNPVWQYKFFVQRRAIKKYKADAAESLDRAALTQAVTELRNRIFDETISHDEELSVAEITGRLLAAEEELTKGLDETTAVRETINKIDAGYDKYRDSAFGLVFMDFVAANEAQGDLLKIKAVLDVLEAWSAVEFYRKEKRWASFKVPHPLDYQNLVHLIRPEPETPELMRDAENEMRRRDGFKLTDDRGTMR